MKSLLCYVLLLFSFCTSSAQNDTADHYLTKSNSHFIIKYTALDTSDIDYLLQRLEQTYAEGVKFLNIKKKLSPVLIYLYDDFRKFMKDNEITDSNTWVMGGALAIDSIKIMSPLSNHMLLKRKQTYEYGVKCLMHEAIHCLCYVYNADLGEKNCWLSEGIAIYLSHQNSYNNRKTIAKISGGTIKKLSDLDSGQNFTMIYGVGYSLIEFIVSKWGNKVMPGLIKNLGDIPKSLGISEKQFRMQWNRFVKLRYLQ